MQPETPLLHVREKARRKRSGQTPSVSLEKDERAPTGTRIQLPLVSRAPQHTVRLRGLHPPHVVQSARLVQARAGGVGLFPPVCLDAIESLSLHFLQFEVLRGGVEDPVYRSKGHAAGGSGDTPEEENGVDG